MSIRTTSGRSSRAAAHARGAVPGLADDLESAGRLEHRAQPEPDEFLVVDEQDPDRHVGQHRLDDEAAVQPGFGGQPAAEGAHPLTQPHQPVAAAGGRLRRAARRR